MSTKRELRAQIVDLGGPNPPKSATRDQLAALVAALQIGRPTDDTRTRTVGRLRRPAARKK